MRWHGWRSRIWTNHVRKQASSTGARITRPCGCETERSWKIGRVDQQTERILQAAEADADAERRAFLKAFEADDQERRRDEALESALRAYEPTSPTSAADDIQ